jgi:hypothetical protein
MAGDIDWQIVKQSMVEKCYEYDENGVVYG